MDQGKLCPLPSTRFKQIQKQKNTFFYCWSPGPPDSAVPVKLYSSCSTLSSLQNMGADIWNFIFYYTYVLCLQDQVVNLVNVVKERPQNYHLSFKNFQWYWCNRGTPIKPWDYKNTQYRVELLLLHFRSASLKFQSFLNLQAELFDSHQMTD